jgi:serine/threonine-protein kinase
VDAPADAARGYAIDAEYLSWVSERDRSPVRWERLRSGQPPTVWFWYRQSPRMLLSTAVLGRVTSRNPPLVDSGMAGVRFDMRGRLVHFYAVPPQRETAAEAARAEETGAENGGEPDWAALFAEAQLDPARFERATPEWSPPFFSDTRAAWTGAFPDRPEIPIRVEAAGYRGRPVWFEVVTPWTRPDRMQSFRFTTRQQVAAVVGVTLVILVVGASAWLAKRNLVRGRGDRAGAWRLAAYTLAVSVVGWALWAHHVADLAGELTLMLRADGVFLLLAALIWLLYLALEPYLRRTSPHLLISWTRLLSGRGRDATVGRDVLVGTAAGALMALVLVVGWRLPGWIGQPATWPKDHDLDSFLGIRERLMPALFGQIDVAAFSLAMVVVLVLLRMVVRSDVAAGLGLMLVMCLPEAIASDSALAIALPLSLAVTAIAVVVLLRFGLLALMLTMYTASRALQSPFSLRFDHWTGAPTAFSLAVIAALLAWGLWASASRRRLAVVHDIAA